MKIMVINPNTTASMTRIIGAAARNVTSPGTDIVAINPDCGPVSIESHYDEVVSAMALLEDVRLGEKEGVDAYVIACFGDPGLLAAREIARGPVLGIAEAAMHVASFIATRFSIVTTLSRTKIIAEHLVQRYGMSHHCVRVRACDVAVLELENPESGAFPLILEECKRARDEDGAGAVVLGCAGMADIVKKLEEELGIPVIDGVSAAVKLAEALVGMGVRTSKHGDLATPIAKPYRGRFADYALTERAGPASSRPGRRAKSTTKPNS